MEKNWNHKPLLSLYKFNSNDSDKEVLIHLDSESSISYEGSQQEDGANIEAEIIETEEEQLQLEGTCFIYP